MTIDVDASIAALNGRPARTTGKPCRNTVDHHGDACPWHATVVGGDPTMKMSRAATAPKFKVLCAQRAWTERTLRACSL